MVSGLLLRAAKTPPTPLLISAQNRAYCRGWGGVTFYIPRGSRNKGKPPGARALQFVINLQPWDVSSSLLSREREAPCCWGGGLPGSGLPCFCPHIPTHCTVASPWPWHQGHAPTG